MACGHTLEGNPFNSQTPCPSQGNFRMMAFIRRLIGRFTSFSRTECTTMSSAPALTRTAPKAPSDWATETAPFETNVVPWPIMTIAPPETGMSAQLGEHGLRPLIVVILLVFTLRCLVCGLAHNTSLCRSSPQSL